MRFLVIIPCFKEMENLRVLIPKLMETYTDSDLLVIDDNSNDQTEALMDAYARSYTNRIYYICRKSDPSYAESLCEGFKFAYENNYQKLIQMDADGSHAVSDIKLLIQANTNIAIGSRYKTNSRIINVPIIRQIISIVGNVYISLLWRTLIRDKTNGFRCYDQLAILKLSDFKTNSKGFAVQIEVLHHLLATKEKLKISEIPISFQFRNLGESKFNVDKLLEALKTATTLVTRKKNANYKT